MHGFAAGLRTIFRQPGFPGILGANFALGMAYALVVPFISLWGTQEVGMTPRVFGTFMTLTCVSAIVLSTVLARWSDTHVTRRTMLIAGSIGGGIGYLGYAFLRDPVLLTLIGCAALGVAAVNFSQLFAHVRDELSRPDHGLSAEDGSLLTSLMRVFFSLAWVTGPLLGAIVMVHWGYRGVFLAASGLFFLFLAAVARFVPHRPHPPSAATAAREPLLRALARPDILAAFVAHVLVFAAHTMNMVNLPLLVTEQLGGTTREVGYIFGVAPIVEIPLMVWFGRLAAQGHQLRLIRLGMVMSIAYFVALYFAQSPLHIYPMQIFTAVSIAITTNVAITFFQDLLPGQAGVATSLYSNAWNVGSLIGYFAFGQLVGAVGYRGIFTVCMGFSVVALGLLFTQRFAQVGVQRPPAPRAVTAGH